MRVPLVGIRLVGELIPEVFLNLERTIKRVSVLNPDPLGSAIHAVAVSWLLYCCLVNLSITFTKKNGRPTVFGRFSQGRDCPARSPDDLIFAVVHFSRFFEAGTHPQL